MGSLTRQARDELLAAFYEGILQQLPQPHMLAEWLEDHLLTDNGFRTPCYLERQFAHRQGIEMATDKKLPRKLFIGDKEHVEIIHDVLVPVVHQRKKKRLEEVKRQEMEKEWRRRRKIIAIVSMAAIIAIGLAIFAFVQKRRADEQYKEAIQHKNRTDEQYKIAVRHRLASEAELILPNDRYKAVRIAEAAYKIGLPKPPAPVLRSLSAAAFTTLKCPFYSRSFHHAGYIHTFVFSPDGRYIISTSFDGASFIRATPETIMEYLKTATFAKLTAEEKKEPGIEGFKLD